LEINPSPQFEGFEKYTGVNVGEKIIEYFEERRNQNR
jgi:glutathione synthase/RimK-type ligase-like ATP-grasp enzyme